VIRIDDSAALARNWWTVLLVDAAMGLAVAVAGVAVLALWHLLGVLMIGVGLAYLLPIARRARRWSGLRREAGL
jgi:hypothetical protein